MVVQRWSSMRASILRAVPEVAPISTRILREARLAPITTGSTPGEFARPGAPVDRRHVRDMERARRAERRCIPVPARVTARAGQPGGRAPTLLAFVRHGGNPREMRQVGFTLGSFAPHRHLDCGDESVRRAGSIGSHTVTPETAHTTSTRRAHAERQHIRLFALPTGHRVLFWRWVGTRRPGERRTRASIRSGTATRRSSAGARHSPDERFWNRLDLLSTAEDGDAT